VRPEKADVFSGSQSRRGKSQSPVTRRWPSHESGPAWRERHGAVVSLRRRIQREVGGEAYEVRGADEIEGAFSKMTRDRVDGVIVFPSITFATERRRLAELAAKHRLPAMFEHRFFTEAGGLLSYGPNILAGFSRAAHFVDKILKCAKPADLPVEQPTKVELVVNLKTVKALGLTIPPAVLLRADQLIQ